MKIIGTRNFDLDDYCEFIICDNVTEYWGKKIEKLLQSQVGDRDSCWPVLKSDDYVPFVWEP